jgi:hypothetical protein
MTNYIYVIAGTLVVVAILYLLRNVFKRIYEAIKFIILPNKYEVVKKEIPQKFAPIAFIAPFLTQISAKTIAYIVIFAIVGTVCFGLYQKITADTYSNDYRNTIKGNKEVTVDQRQIIIGAEDKLLIGIKIFGLKVGISIQSKDKVPTTITNNGQVVTPQPVVETPKSSVTPVVTPKPKVGFWNKLFTKEKK